MKGLLDKLTDRDKNLLLVLLIAVILFCAFQFGYKNLNDKADVVSEEVKELKADYEKLYDMAVNEERYKALTVENDNVSAEILGKYAANSTQEFQIVFLNTLESAANWIYVYSVPAIPTSSVISNAAGLTGNVSNNEINFKANYDDAMAFFKNVNYNALKTGMSNISIAYNRQDNTITGTATLNLYSITGTDRTPETIVVPTVQIGREDASIFNSNTFTPNMSFSDQAMKEQIRSNSDIYVLVNPWGSTLDSVIVGLSKDNNSANKASVNKNESSDVVINVSGKNGQYSVSYQVGGNTVTDQTLVKEGGINLLISSSIRPTNVDLVEANISIINNSDVPVNYTIINDDDANPRVMIGTTEGNVVVY